MDHHQLSPEQRQAVSAAVVDGKSVLVTGGAGTGKSATLKEIIVGLQRRFGGRPGAVAVVAPTGVAAVNVGGTTIHSWAKLKLLDKARAAKMLGGDPRPWRSAKVMIIDEISMVADWLFELLDRLGRKHCNAELPFGGIQLVLCGDFLQLAPIDGKYCFESPAWNALDLQRFELSYAFRQGMDAEFARMLGEVHVGRASAQTLATLQQQRVVVMQEQADIVATQLYAVNRDVDAENSARLKLLPGPCITYTAQDSGVNAAFKKPEAWTNAPTKLELKQGAQVVLLKNLDVPGGLVNGSRGLVVGFANGPVVRFVCGKTVTLKRETWTKKDDQDRDVATRKQFPLALAWALTIHKSQGMSLDRVRVNLDCNFAPCGLAYVALSRCRTLAGLTVSGLTGDKIKADPRALAFQQEEEEEEEERPGPCKRVRRDPEDGMWEYDRAEARMEAQQDAEDHWSDPKYLMKHDEDEDDE
jgi:ATP-dependent DNA helicase PIF1